MSDPTEKPEGADPQAGEDLAAADSADIAEVTDETVADAPSDGDADAPEMELPDVVEDIAPVLDEDTVEFFVGEEAIIEPSEDAADDGESTAETAGEHSVDAGEESAEPDAGDEAEQTPPEATPDPASQALAEALGVIERVTGYAVQEGPSRFFARSLKPWLKKANDVAADTPAHTEAVSNLAQAIEGWTDLDDDAKATRVKALHATVQALIAEVGESVGLSAPQKDNEAATGNAEKAESKSSRGRRSSRRRRGRRGRGNREADQTENRQEGAEATPEQRAPKARPEKPPKPPQRFLLDDEEGAGQPLSNLGAYLPVTLEALQATGIESIADLLKTVPTGYDELPQPWDGEAPLEPGTRTVVRGRSKRRLTRLQPLGRRFEATLTVGDAGVVNCQWANTPDEETRQGCRPGKTIALTGVVGETEETGEQILLDCERIALDDRGRSRVGRYDIEGIDDIQVRSMIRDALSLFGNRIEDPIPEPVRGRVRVIKQAEALRRIHFPAKGHRRGVERLAFDELLLYQLGRRKQQPAGARAGGTARKVAHGALAQILQQHQIQLTDAQECVFSAVRRDLAGNRPMNRLIQGEVGAGKGLIALLTAVIVASQKDQVVFLAPDALTAEHRYLFAEPILRSIGLVPKLIPDRPTAAQADALKRGTDHVIFATPAFTEPWPEFRRLGLVVSEERDARGLLTQSQLPTKGAQAELLALSIAPLPTSLSLTVFGDMDMSVVEPPLSTGVRLSTFGADARGDAYEAAAKEVAQGRQAYVVFPLVDGEERLELRDLARLADALRKEAFADSRIGVFSGRMSREERRRVFDDFKHRRLDVLLTTTLIEDSPSVPNATAMVLEQADRYDLLRLHRLRAHVARGVRTGQVLLVNSDQPSEEGLERVELIAREKDGFRIAEYDLIDRGADTLLGDRANEIPDFRYVRPLEHQSLLAKARSEAFALLERDPNISRGENRHLRRALERSWERWFEGEPQLEAKKGRGRRKSGRRRRRRRGKR